MFSILEGDQFMDMWLRRVHLYVMFVERISRQVSASHTSVKKEWMWSVPPFHLTRAVSPLHVHVLPAYDGSKSTITRPTSYLRGELPQVGCGGRRRVGRRGGPALGCLESVAVFSRCTCTSIRRFRLRFRWTVFLFTLPTSLSLACCCCKGAGIHYSLKYTTVLFLNSQAS